MNKIVSRKIFIICFHTHSHASAVKMLNPGDGWQMFIQAACSKGAGAAKNAIIGAPICCTLIIVVQATNSSLVRPVILLGTKRRKNKFSTNFKNCLHHTHAYTHARASTDTPRAVVG